MVWYSVTEPFHFLTLSSTEITIVSLILTGAQQKIYLALSGSCMESIFSAKYLNDSILHMKYNESSIWHISVNISFRKHRISQRWSSWALIDHKIIHNSPRLIEESFQEDGSQTFLFALLWDTSQPSLRAMVVTKARILIFSNLQHSKQ